VTFALDGFHRHRLITSLIAEEIGRLRQREITPNESLSWTDATLLGENTSDTSDANSLDAGSLDLDSLGRIDVAARLNQFFHLHEVGIEDYLLIEKTIGRWNFIVGEAFKQKCDWVTFQTSGSTGTPKTTAHEIANLLNEARELVDILKRPRRIISMVPPHHIYGFIFTVLLPVLMNIEVIDARVLSPGKLRALLIDGDVIVATPHLWRYLATSLSSLPEGVLGTSSTAPMPTALAEELKRKGLSRLTEIYGSTETSGIAWRSDPQAAFKLFDIWSVSDDRESISRRIENTSSGSSTFGISTVGPAIPFGDKVEFDGERHLRPVRRRDGAVQVGGVNVFPERVKHLLAEHDGILEVAVRGFSVGGDGARQRLKAFVVPKTLSDLVALEKSLRSHAAERMSAVEQPAAYAFGEALPRNAFGKLTDWN
jgi:long-chain acyl-CoA synthetase